MNPTIYARAYHRMAKKPILIATGSIVGIVRAKIATAPQSPPAEPIKKTCLAVFIYIAGQYFRPSQQTGHWRPYKDIYARTNSTVSNFSAYQGRIWRQGTSGCIRGYSNAAFFEEQ